MNTRPDHHGERCSMQEGHGEDEQPPPDEHLAEVIGMAGIPPEAVRDKPLAVLAFALKADFWASLTVSITSPSNQITAPAIVQSPNRGAVVSPRR